MDSRNPDELIAEVKEEQQTRGELATEALQWFLDGNVGELFSRRDMTDTLSDELDITNRQANTAISDTVGDIVDPVQQIVKGNKKYVGIIAYKAFNDEGAYGYVDFDDRKGQRKRVVCARCVEKHTYDENIKHATQAEGSSNADVGWQQLLNKVTSHYATQHTTSPSTVEPGASLVSGTTISGSTAFHQGNESSISHDSISGVSGSDHHSRYSDSEAQSATHSRYTDSEARSATNNRNHFVDVLDFNNSEHSDLNNTSIAWDNSEGGGSLNGGVILEDTNGTDGWLVASDEDSYTIQKNGSDGNNIINFKT